MFGNKQLTPAVVVSDALGLLEAFQAVQLLCDRPCSARSSVKWKWKAPSCDVVKCNVDGAWKDHRGGIGVIFRDFNGRVLLSGIFPVMHATEPLHVEILAAMKGLEIAKAFNFHRLIVETDCIGVVQGINNPAASKSIFGHYFTAIRDQVQQLEDISFSYTKREANVPAHRLSKLAILADDSCIWYADIPPSVTSAVADDCLS